MIDSSLTQTVRLYCDGELSPDEALQFERKLEGDVALQQAVVFERNLRKRLDAVLSAQSVKAPPALADRIRNALVEDDAPAPIKIESHREAQYPTWRINYLAVAAVLTLVAGAVIFGIVFPQIDTIQNTPNDVTQTELLAEIGTIVATEHDRLAGDRNAADQELVLNDLEDTAFELSQHLESRVTPVDLSELGYTFFGAAKCGGILPCGGPSAHMLFKKVRDDGTFTGPNISIYIVPEGHLADFLDIKVRRRWVNNGTSTKCGHQVYRLDYPDTGLVYFLVTCDPSVLEPASQKVLEQLRAANPAPAIP